jgi:polyisoprenoid-binding protein YceI
MPRYDENTAEARVFTFKDGLLSKVAHDLEIQVTRFSVEVDPSTSKVRAEFDPQSLRVVGAVSDGQVDPQALSDADKAKIAAQIQKDVLGVDQHPRITFSSKKVERRPDGGYSIEGDLLLHGTTKSITAQTRLEAGKQVALVEIDQLDYGITPFKAMLGTLKVKPVVRVRFAVPNG